MSFKKKVIIEIMVNTWQYLLKSSVHKRPWLSDNLKKKKKISNVVNFAGRAAFRVRIH